MGRYPISLNEAQHRKAQSQSSRIAELERELELVQAAHRSTMEHYNTELGRRVNAESSLSTLKARVRKVIEQVLWHRGTDKDRYELVAAGKSWKTTAWEAIDDARSIVANELKEE